MRDKVTRQCPQTTTCKEKRELKSIQTKVPLLTSLTPYRLAKPAHVIRMNNWISLEDYDVDGHTEACTFVLIAFLFSGSLSTNHVLGQCGVDEGGRGWVRERKRDTGGGSSGSGRGRCEEREWIREGGGGRVRGEKERFTQILRFWALRFVVVVALFLFYSYL